VPSGGDFATDFRATEPPAAFPIGMGNDARPDGETSETSVMTRKKRGSAEADRGQGPGDPVWSMQLLWGVLRRPGRGPKPGLDVERIVAAAIALADREGLAAVSMRRVADELGVGAMSLYTYVPGKGELLELMYDRALGEEAWGFDGASGWRDKLEQVMRRTWAFYQRHPWMLEIPVAQAPLGPNAIQAFDRALSALTGLGLTGREMANVVSLVSTFLRGAAQAAAEAQRAHERTGVTDSEWWLARAPILEKLMAGRFPTLYSPELAGAFDPARTDVDYFPGQARGAFEFGLQTLLDGVAALIERRAAR
jgi:AcrR family transcriptional regulator